MVSINIKDTGLRMNTDSMGELSNVDMLVIHHTGSEVDRDFSAKEINDMHINGNHWSGIGYHFVVRKNGDIERGRPEWAIGAHAQGSNYHTLGIHLSGEYHLGNAIPPEAQLESTARLVAYLCEKYDIQISRSNVVGHREVGESDCPGDRLFALLPKIVNRAKEITLGITNSMEDIEFEQNDIDYLVNQGYSLLDAKKLLASHPKYANGGQKKQESAPAPKDNGMDLRGPNGIVFEENDVQYLLNQGYTLQDAKEFLATADKYKAKPSTPQSTTQSKNDDDEEDWDTILELSAEYESGGDPGSVSSGAGDLGGVSYGLYQFASANGSIDAFISWAKSYKDPTLAQYAKDLAACGINTYAFQDKWEEIGRNDPNGFTELQNQYVISKYYNTAANMLAKAYYHIENHTTAMKAVLFSRSIQYGPGNMVDLFETACDRLGYANLSYVDSADYDAAMIKEIYTFLVEECDSAYARNGLYHSPNDWCNGSYTVVKIGLRNRFVNEMNKALKLIA